MRVFERVALGSFIPIVVAHLKNRQPRRTYRHLWHPLLVHKRKDGAPTAWERNLAIHRYPSPKLFPMIIVTPLRQPVSALPLRDFGMLLPQIRTGLHRPRSDMCSEDPGFAKHLQIRTAVPLGSGLQPRHKGREMRALGPLKLWASQSVS